MIFLFALALCMLQISRMSDASLPNPLHSTVDPRVRFAAERTLLAWIRTGLSMMGFGFVVARFAIFLKEVGEVTKVIQLKYPHTTDTSLYIGTSLILLGVFINFNAAWGFFNWSRSNPAFQEVPKKRLQFPVAAITACILGVIGIIMAVRLLEII